MHLGLCKSCTFKLCNKHIDETHMSSATEKEKFRISSENLAVQWHSCNFK
jgi:hypothetical protein